MNANECMPTTSNLHCFFNNHLVSYVCMVPGMHYCLSRGVWWFHALRWVGHTRLEKYWYGIKFLQSTSTVLLTCFVVLRAPIPAPHVWRKRATIALYPFHIQDFLTNNTISSPTTAELINLPWFCLKNSTRHHHEVSKRLSLQVKCHGLFSRYKARVRLLKGIVLVLESKVVTEHHFFARISQNIKTEEKKTWALVSWLLICFS